MQVTLAPPLRAIGAAGLLQHLQALADPEQRAFARMDTDCEDEPVGQCRRVADDVDMAVGDRVERAGIEGNSRHICV